MSTPTTPARIPLDPNTLIISFFAALVAIAVLVGVGLLIHTGYHNGNIKRDQVQTCLRETGKTAADCHYAIYGKF